MAYPRRWQRPDPGDARDRGYAAFRHACGCHRIARKDGWAGRRGASCGSPSIGWSRAAWHDAKAIAGWAALPLRGGPQWTTGTASWHQTAGRTDPTRTSADGTHPAILDGLLSLLI